MPTIQALAAVAMGLVIVFAGSRARADPTGDPAAPPVAPPPPKAAAPVLQRQQLGTAAFANVARARMRSGDCAGALDAFDAAIAHSIDPSLKRDRGLCHEQLGHPYPAIDDYRQYLTAEPEAADAPAIRTRLSRLEMNTTGKSSAGRDDDTPPDAPALADGAAASGSVTVTVGSGDASAAADGTSAAQKARDRMDYVDRDDDWTASSLRRGKGYSLAPIFSVHKWFNSGASFGESDTWAECIGLQLRDSFGRVPTLFVEAAYQHFNSTSSSTDSVQGNVQGLSSQVGVEFRFLLDPDGDNQLFAAPGIGFEHIVASGNLAGSSALSSGALVPRGRFGYRHMVSPSAGIDLSLDGGVGKFARYDNGDFPFGGSAPAVAMVALDVALVWGL